jgi:hypothetical protein
MHNSHLSGSDRRVLSAFSRNRVFCRKPQSHGWKRGQKRRDEARDEGDGALWEDEIRGSTGSKK